MILRLAREGRDGAGLLAMGTVDRDLITDCSENSAPSRMSVFEAADVLSL